MDFKRKIKKLPVICILLISLFCFASLKTFKTKAENTEDKQPVKTFSDIQDHKAKETIEKLASQGIISGIDENRFAPDQKIKRAEYVDWIIKALGLDETKYKDCFKDVKSDNKYAEVLQTAFDKKLIDPGMLDQGNFKPDAPVSREELASFNVKAFRFKTKNNSVIGNLDRYEDANLISKWAVDSAKTAVALGLIKTVSSTKFSPADAMSRADAAIHIDILLSLLSDYLSGNHPDLIPDMPDIKPLINVKMRDTSICVGGDGMYYLTG